MDEPKRMWRTRGRRAFLAIAVTAAWSAGTAAIAEAQRPIRIGASFSQTGSLAPSGQNMHRGVQLCVKHADDKGGVLGRRIALLVEDDQSEGATAVTVYEKLITQDEVDAILGPGSSPLTEPVADVSERHRMPMIANAAATPIYKKGRKFVFGVSSPAERFLDGGAATRCLIPSPRKEREMAKKGPAPERGLQAPPAEPDALDQAASAPMRAHMRHAPGSPGAYVKAFQL